MYKKEIDLDCIDCQFFYQTDTEMYGPNSEPGTAECELEWDCPFMEDDDETWDR